MESLKALAGFTVLVSFVLGCGFVIYVLTWFFRILGFLVAVILVVAFLSFVGWSWITECLLPKKDKGEQ